MKIYHQNYCYVNIFHMLNNLISITFKMLECLRDCRTKFHFCFDSAFLQSVLSMKTKDIDEQ